ncbi:MAG: alpha/beta hydrolase [Actinobacteria bacterium 13_1_20CM_3_71_11]|nr:MAG: alpha/beta hydrolase [Actinobacteria bacterium 13_1_20CM_3_71_11]
MVTRADVELHTADGLRLVGELARPAGPPVATLICLHPLPTHGGTMDSHVLRKAADRLPARGLAVLRFNSRGTGGSQGTFDRGEGERHDVAAAIQYADFAGLPRIWLVGWSFGADLALTCAGDPDVCGVILLSPPLRWVGDGDLRSHGKPVIALVPEFDDFLRPDEARRRLPEDAEVVGVPGAKHLWVGYADTVLDEIVRRVVPGQPLP